MTPQFLLKKLYIELVEVYYKLGLKMKKQSKQLQYLGYNYQSSTWYEKSYKVFNKKYEEIKKLKRKKKWV